MLSVCRHHLLLLCEVPPLLEDIAMVPLRQHNGTRGGEYTRVPRILCGTTASPPTPKLLHIRPLVAPQFGIVMLASDPVRLLRAAAGGAGEQHKGQGAAL